MTIFADLSLARRLESTEGHACRGFAEARRALDPASDAAWLECAGAIAVFDGIDSPITQSFGLGVGEEASDAAMDQLEAFFFDRKTAAVHEVSPLAGVPLADRLCARGYRPIEISSVLFQILQPQPPVSRDRVTVRIVNRSEAPLWADTSARGWASDYPAMLDSIRQFGLMASARPQNLCFLAEHGSLPGAAGVVFLHEDVALFGGASTVPELRRHGLQAALLQARLQYASEHGCNLAMMVTEAGSQSQRNAERAGFRIAYTRTKWRLAPPSQ